MTETPLQKTYLIGVDSGGSHVTADCYNPQGTVLSHGEAGPGNIILDQPRTLRNLVSAIEQAAAPLRAQGWRCRQVLIGIAGWENFRKQEATADELTCRLHKYADRSCFAFTSDARLALLNALDGQDGLLAIAGTGSIIYAKNGGCLSRVGGWGWLLGDEGSAYQIAAEAVKAVLHASDQGQVHPLSPLILSYFSATTLPDLVTAFYQSSRPRIAGLAKQLAGKAVAEPIFVHQADLLAQQILLLFKRNPGINPVLALSGSVLTLNSLMQAELRKIVSQQADLTIKIAAKPATRGVLFI